MKKLVVAVAGAVLLTQSVHIEAEAPGARGTVAQMQEEKEQMFYRGKRRDLLRQPGTACNMCRGRSRESESGRKENGCRCHFKPGGR